jgi:Domain of Unknown Function with PDB structure (DUF3857)
LFSGASSNPEEHDAIIGEMRADTGYRPRRIALLILISLLATAAIPALAGEKTPTKEEKAMTEDPAHGIVDAVYLDKFFETQRLSCHTSVRAKIFSKAGFDIGMVEGLSAGAYQIEGRTYGPDGKVTKLDSGSVRLVTVVKAGGRSLSEKTFTMLALEPGCIIEYSYREPGDFGSYGESFLEIPFQAKYATLHQTVQTPRPFNFTATVRQQNGVGIRLRQEGQSYLYETRNAPSVRPEVYGLPLSLRSASLIFSRVLSELPNQQPDEFWKDAAKKVLGPYFKKVLLSNGNAKSRMASIPGSRESDPKARLSALYRYVQTNLTNRDALAAGKTPPLGGWKPNEDAGDTVSHGSGTPRDLAFVFASLVRADGWKYRFVLVTDHERRLYFPTIPSFYQFDSLLVEVDDPAQPDHHYDFAFDNPMLPFGLIPWNYTSTQALTIDPEQGAQALIEIKPTTADDNTQRSQWRLGLRESGDVELEKSNRYRGLLAFDERARLLREGPAKIEADQKQAYSHAHPAGDLSTLRFLNGDKPDDDLTIELQATMHEAVLPLPGGRLAVSPLSFIGQSNPFVEESRHEPIRMGYPFERDDEMTITPPKDYRVEGLPSAVNVMTGAGSYSASASRKEDGTVAVHRRFRLAVHSASPEYYSEYRRLYAGAVRGDEAFSLVFSRIPGGKAQ